MYLELRFLTKTFYVSFELDLLCSNAKNCDWRSPRVKSRNGFPFFVTICIDALLIAAVLNFASIALADKFVFMQHGMFTPDALLYAVVTLPQLM